MISFPPFPDFYRAVNGREPFPWQARLADSVVRDGWPRTIGVPTGMGKTGCIDIAVWALASQGSLAPRDRWLPTRIWYVVNRRLLIDSAHAHGERLKDALGNSKDDILATVREALCGMAGAGSEQGPLHVTRLRGGADLGARPPDPSQPSLILATVPMFASRWLFRGYGTSRSMRPVDAALAGIDSLVLLDEAHLSRCLASLTQPLEECDLGDPSLVLPTPRSRPVLVALTATADIDGDTFDLDSDDLAHPVIRRRLAASKPTSLVETTEKKLVPILAEQALSRLVSSSEPVACVILANTPRRAREIWKEIERRKKDLTRGVDIVLATGRMRDREAEGARTRLLDESLGAPAGRDRSLPRPTDLIAIATQTLEVGADLDFDLLITETPGARSLVQRFGRLNRLGDTPGAAAVVCHPADVKEGQWPVYGGEPAEVWTRLRAAARDGFVDLGPSKVNGVSGPPSDVPAQVGELLPVHLWEWAKTTFPPPGEAPIELFFQGLDDADRGRVSICWRAHRPGDGIRLYPAVTEAESVEIVIGEVKASLRERGLDEVKRLASDRASLETVPTDSIVPGDHLVLAATDGLYDEHGWNPEATQVVLDVSLLRAPTLPLTADSLSGLCPQAEDLTRLKGLMKKLEGDKTNDEPLGRDEEKGMVTELLDGLAASQQHPWLSDVEWEQFLASIGATVERSVDDVAYLPPRADSQESYWPSATVRADAFEELSFDLASKTLAAHLRVVGETAAKMAEAVGLPRRLVETVRRAGEFHDIGKADARFQRWLDPDGRATELVAKSDMPRHRIEASRVASGWPKGGRHELLSGRLVGRWLQNGSLWDGDADLLVHLVLTHHGQGRPSSRIVGDDSPLDIGWRFEGSDVTVLSALSLHDWEQPRRFRELCQRYGYWGLGLLEACVRQADQAASGARAI